MPEARIIHGDALDVLSTLAEERMDAIVTDPPYELGFMGRAWDASGIAYNVDLWKQCLRVLKPGGHLLAFGGTRTYHRLACAIEDAGFEIRDSITWLYGSGFPKSLDVSKAIDKAPPGTDDAKRWAGWGTALKPAHEPIVVARKPLVGTVAQNVLAHGTGALNIDANRVAHANEADRAESEGKNRHADFGSGPRDNKVYGADNRDRGADGNYDGSRGRWPTNVVLSHAPLLDEVGEVVGDACADGCVAGCPVAELDRQSGSRPAGSNVSGAEPSAPVAYHVPTTARVPFAGYGDTGGASRFFPVFRYEAKAPTRERPRSGDVAHPTVKPLALMRWLIRLITAPGGVILDPFAGSGTTLEACLLEGFYGLGIEQHADYLPLIRQRIERASP